MDISIVIINYNVKHFLEQCLHSVEKSLVGLEGEVFVVDNDSVDGSCQMVRQKFPNVHLIENKDNVGFSVANNQAIRLSKGKYVLLLNPDTLIQEDTLKKCIDFCDEHTDAGGLGVKMIDGKGHFLPESKRALPTPFVSFCKIFGLSSLFPKSKIFARYHLGFLNKDENHKVEILAGAYMMLRKSVLNKIGLLDETFFMYGEDIDLSYRILKEGYQNYYFSDTTIIHYKGESTKKGSINYVMVFYKAMIIFAKKHFSARNAWLYSAIINFAVYLRAGAGIIKRLISRTFKPIFDFVLIFFSFKFLTPYWEAYQFGRGGYYPPSFYLYIVPFYIAVWMFFLFMFGAYERRVRPMSVVRGVMGGTITILLVYALLPESVRFSRALILLGSVGTLLLTSLVRVLSVKLFKNDHSIEYKTNEKRIAIVGSAKETQRVKSIMLDAGLHHVYIGRIGIAENDKEDVLGAAEQLKEIVRINNLNELVFCSQDLSAAEIIEIMLSNVGVSTDFKIAPPESASVIGSNSINTAGDLYVVDINSLAKGLNKRKKRMFDIASGFLLIAFSPILLFFIPGPFMFLKNCLHVMVGKKTWVGVKLEGYHGIQASELKKGVLSPADRQLKKSMTPKLEERLNVAYAKDYKVVNDVVIVLGGFRMLGREV